MGKRKRVKWCPAFSTPFVHPYEANLGNGEGTKHLHNIADKKMSQNGRAKNLNAPHNNVDTHLARSRLSWALALSKHIRVTRVRLSI